MLRPSKFQLNAENTPDTEKSFKFKPSALSVPCSAGSSWSNNSPTGNHTSNNPQVPENDASKDASNTGSLAKNPFMKGFSREEESPSKGSDTNSKEESKKDENLDPLSKLNSSSTGALPKSNLISVKAATLSSGTDFVFGQNIGERVTTSQGSNIFGSTSTKTEDDKEKTENEANSSCNGAGTSATGLFFSNVASSNSRNAERIELREVDGKSLLEATRQYEEKVKVQKRKYEEVETITGEEDEKNVREINCKIFAFEDRNYEERGRGTLRLNDSKIKMNESRVVFRTSGNFRVLINTKVWSKMTVEKPSTKSMRMTAIDSNGHIKVFLVQARPDDITDLFKDLTNRVDKLKEIEQSLSQKSKELAESSTATTRTNEIHTISPAQTICIKISDETGENECKNDSNAGKNEEKEEEEVKENSP